MEDNHSTSVPEQMRTETVEVVIESRMNDFESRTVRTIDVPLYSQPDSSGVKLDKDKRNALAVARAVENMEIKPIEGEEMGVKRDIGGDIEWVEYEKNPSFDGVWSGNFKERASNADDVTEAESSEKPQEEN